MRDSEATGTPGARPPRRIGITGALGFIGAHLTGRALARGFAVRTFTRRSWTGTPFVAIDERRELVLPGMPSVADLEGLDALLHLAVAPHGSSAAVTEAVNVAATVGLADVARRAGVGRFVFVSTQSAHDGARNRYGRTKREAERRLEGRPGVLIVRPGLVYDGGPEGLLGMASAAAAKLRAFPVMGGKDAIAQTIHIDDLCDALLRFATPELDPHLPQLIELAEPTRWPLGELVASTAQARFGVRPRLVDIPLRAAKGGARIANALHVAEAVSEVVDGIVAFRPMDTEPQLRELGIELRRFDARAAVEAYDERAQQRRDADPPATGTDAKRLILVGSGRIGSAHALVARHHPDAVLAALVDPAKGAAARIQGLVGAVAWYPSLDDALADPALAPTAAIVATPPSTHADLASRLLAAGVHVLVEKPVTPRVDDRGRLLDAARDAGERTGATCAGGYHHVQLPHVLAAADRLQSGAFGAVTGFAAFGFVARAVQRSKKVSWELDPERSGGGALPQVAAHVLSVLDLLVGPLDVLDATLVCAPDREVEDATWVHLTNGAVSGSLFAGWHLADFTIPENTTRIATDRGTLVVSSGMAVFFPVEGDPVAVSALDEPVGFDPTPYDAGGGFWLEQRLLLAGTPRRNDLDMAARVERITTSAYAKAQRIAPVAGTTASRVVDVPFAPAGDPPPAIVDLRRLTLPGALSAARRGGCYVVGTAEHRELAGSGAELLLVAPDLVGAFRTATNEGPVALVKSFGVGNLVKSGFGVRPTKAITPTGRMWQGFAALLRAEVGSVPRDFAGRVAVDGYLVDLAGALGRLDEIEMLVETLRHRFPHATVGLDTNAPASAAVLLPVVRDSIGFVLTIGAPGVDVAGRLRAAAGREDLDVYVKTGAQPPEIVKWAAGDPQPWVATSGAEGDGGARGVTELVVDWRGATGFSDANVEVLARAIRTTGCPGWAAADAHELLGITAPSSS